MIIIIFCSTGKAYKIKALTLLHTIISMQTTSNSHLCYTETRDSVIHLAIVMENIPRFGRFFLNSGEYFVILNLKFQ